MLIKYFEQLSNSTFFCFAGRFSQKEKRSKNRDKMVMEDCVAKSKEGEALVCTKVDYC